MGCQVLEALNSRPVNPIPSHPIPPPRPPCTVPQCLRACPDQSHCMTHTNNGFVLLEALVNAESSYSHYYHHCYSHRSQQSTLRLKLHCIQSHPSHLSESYPFALRLSVPQNRDTHSSVCTQACADTQDSSYWMACSLHNTTGHEYA